MIKNTLQQAQNIDFLKIKCNNSVPGLVSWDYPLYWVNNDIRPSESWGGIKIKL
jgi:hypothetical protein